VNYIFAYTINPVVFSSLISKQIDLKWMYFLIPVLGYVFNGAGLKNKIAVFCIISLLKITIIF